MEERGGGGAAWARGGERRGGGGTSFSSLKIYLLLDVALVEFMYLARWE